MSQRTSRGQESNGSPRNYVRRTAVFAESGTSGAMDAQALAEGSLCGVLIWWRLEVDLRNGVNCLSVNEQTN